MTTSNITCPNCKKNFEINDAIQRQIEDELQKQKDEQSENLRREYEQLNQQVIEEAVEFALENQKQQLTGETNKLKLQLELAEQKAKSDAELALDKYKKSTEFENSKLQSQIDFERENNKEFQNQLKELFDKLNKAEREKETAELKAREQFYKREKEIREEAAKKANQDNYIKIREQEEIINKLSQQLTEAKQVAEQGSQQLQGEILEMDIENLLIANFKFDTITEVKKGEYGADIRQIINDFTIQNCGLILWECKNAKNWSEKWSDKLKEEIIAEKAQAGIIVWLSHNNSDDYKQLDDNMWLVKPQVAIIIGHLIRDSIIKLGTVNRNNENKSTKTEMLYNYLMGDEFKNRFQTIITAYTDMQNSQKKERNRIMKMWAEQDKLIDVIGYNLIGMSGEMKGISGQEIIALPNE